MGRMAAARRSSTCRQLRTMLDQGSQDELQQNGATPQDEGINDV